ncbi:hypothetical protein LguiB_014355 [Lonicera macranthoides]
MATKTGKRDRFFTFRFCVLKKWVCGVIAMDPFLKKFFPSVYWKTKEPSLISNYCKYDNQGLHLFKSSLYLAGLTATFFASYTSRRLGWRLTMLIAGVFFIVGVILNATAMNLVMLIIGRILLGCGVGFANQHLLGYLGQKKTREEGSPVAEILR